MELFGFSLTVLSCRSMENVDPWRQMKASQKIKEPCKMMEVPAWPHGCWPFKGSGRGRGASWLRCFCLSLSVSAPGPRRLKGFPKGQVRTANNFPFLCVKPVSASLYLNCMLKLLMRGAFFRVWLLLWSVGPAHSLPGPLSPSSGSFILQKHLSSWYINITTCCTDQSVAPNLTLVFVYL